MGPPGGQAVANPMHGELRAAQGVPELVFGLLMEGTDHPVAGAVAVLARRVVLQVQEERTGFPNAWGANARRAHLTLCHKVTPASGVCVTFRAAGLKKRNKLTVEGGLRVTKREVGQ